jgi:hypothetical protein
MVKCQTNGCNAKNIRYGYIKGKPIACKEHRITDMFDVTAKKCVCGKVTPSFGLDINKSPTHCKECKTDKMINVKSKKCPCGTIPSYGLPDDKLPTCCAECKKEDMINIISKRCPCGKIPSFGLPDDKTPTCCAICKKNDMINIVNKKCPCGKIPCFGLPDDKSPICCAKCKKEGMINIVSKFCSCGSKKQAFYGFINDKIPTCCAICKKNDMVNIKCKKCLCGSQPSFGLLTDNIPICCVRCKSDDMIDLKHKNTLCKATDNNGKLYCNTRANSNYDDYCTHCFANLFPLDPRTLLIRKKTKEIAVRNFINKYFIEFHHDEPLWIDGCDCTHRRRIDHRRLINGTLVCIGTDEFQHRSYDKYDEIIRYDDLMMIHGGKFIYIRFNPDSYKENGIKKDPPMEERLEALKKEIEKQILRVENDDNTELLEIIHMYYNC